MVREANVFSPFGSALPGSSSAVKTSSAAFLDAEEGGGLPASWWLTGWAGVKQLPPLLPSEFCDICCQRVLGKFVVGLLVTMFVGITFTISHQSYAVGASDLGKFCRFVIYTEALIAFGCLFTLQYLGHLFHVRRTPTTCFPLPDELVRRMRIAAADQDRATVTSAMRAAASGMGNIKDPAGERGVYCVRCFVWRDEDGHHCSECNRCTNDFDHHCGVLGCCVGGRGRVGNMWLFTTLISMAAAVRSAQAPTP